MTELVGSSLKLLFEWQVMWNRVPLSKFKPVRRIRQGCPLFPYLFVLCMEWLGHLIQSAISEGKWSPIRLSRNGPAISHFFFTDDLIIFSKVDLRHSGVLKTINARKTNILFSRGVDEIMVSIIGTMFGFQRVHNLDHYLGTSNTLLFVVEKVRGKLYSWEAKKLSLAGHVTLAQSVLLSIRSYFMQSMMIPRKI
ncbi:hypothetical protein PVK06_019395 [Gossypium arboreum]|uniref:Reverse transcriptase domain-containing protein n=1 Tax=Gossypium arboreum TaxID=29729 RepID=A0ABR0PJK5_GOSAR|nr:hypothetical protein PVK06_019395 [Gossypium arboreum]